MMTLGHQRKLHYAQCAFKEVLINFNTFYNDFSVRMLNEYIYIHAHTHIYIYYIWYLKR
jgi:hypothetical protein